MQYDVIWYIQIWHEMYTEYVNRYISNKTHTRTQHADLHWLFQRTLEFGRRYKFPQFFIGGCIVEA